MDSDVQIGPYRILRRLSKGGMGSVYEAIRALADGPASAAVPGSTDEDPPRVAIKILSPEHAGSPEIIARFFNESRAVNRVGDPGLVRMFEDGQLPDGTAYIIMELLDGETLGQRVRRLGNRPPLTSTLRLLHQVASTLANTHAKGIVHRDLKPDNIMIVADPATGGERTKVLDFGIAKLREPMQGPADMTRSDVLMGTPGYMSPEQCRGAGGVDEKTDVYSFGVMLFRVLAGRMPFVGVGAGDVMAMHQYEEPPALAELAPWLPQELTELVHRLLSKDKARRPSMREVAAELDRMIVSLKDLTIPEPPPLTVPALPGIIDDASRPSFPYESAEGLDSDSMMPTISAESSRASTPRISRELGLSLSQPSTLHGSVGEHKRGGAPLTHTRRLAFAAVSVALLSGAMALVLSLRSTPHLSRPAPQVAAPPPPPSAPRRVTWSIASEPAGADVVRVADGTVLGRTPWRGEVDAEPGTEEVVVHLAGHVARRVRLERGSDERRDLVLQPEPVVSGEKKAGSRRSRAPRSRPATEG